MSWSLNRRQLLRGASAATAGWVAQKALAPLQAAASEIANSADPLTYALASSMYGTLPLGEIVPEMPKVGAKYLDLWPRPHGNQREQLDELGDEAFGELLAEHGVQLGMLTRYDLGPLRLADELPVAQRHGAKLIITGSTGPKGLRGVELKEAVANFLRQLQPTIAAAEEAGITIGIENHANALIENPDSLRWLADMTPSDAIGVALAPYHLPQEPELLAGLIEDLGPRLVHFYAWQHGAGSHTEQPKEQELLQMPGRGALDFAPLLTALRKIDYQHWTQIFMHPYPRGIPILPTAVEVTGEINRSRRYLAEVAAA